MVKTKVKILEEESVLLEAVRAAFKNDINFPLTLSRYFCLKAKSESQPSKVCGGKSGWVYFIGSKGLIKIGSTTNEVKKRVAALKVGNPDMTLLATIKSEDCRKLEKQLHRHFAKNNINGEWYKITFNTIKKHIQLYLCQ